MITPQIGETFVWGHDQATAQALLAAAEQVGRPVEDVRTTINGFVVPDDVAEAAAQAMHGDPVPPDPTDPDQQF